MRRWSGKVLNHSLIDEVRFGLARLKGFEEELSGTTVEQVEACGKALLIRFRTGLSLYSHNRLYGRWFVRARGELPATRRSLRVALHTRTHSALLCSASPPFRNRSLASLYLDQQFAAGVVVSGVSARMPRSDARVGNSSGGRTTQLPMRCAACSPDRVAWIFDPDPSYPRDCHLIRLQDEMEKFANQIRGYYENPLDPLATQFMFRRPPTVGELRRPPQVLLLGNHSSGKSTFVNHLLGVDVQNTGVAPTDDGFTIITYGATATERDGAAVVSNPDLPYEGLRHFGGQLVSHLQLKLRPAELLRTVTLIDSPGMIDEAKVESGRGFDFPGVVRWFAERADLVMVFFDPDKPGTTGETLRVFRESLAGIDHKMLIILNKVDQFQTLHDFARAYGALCWNLGKVIPRKDLPMIYNTFVPLADKPKSRLPMEDFEKARNDLIGELRRTPTRRMDNQITQIQAYAERLRLHATVIGEAANRLRATRARWVGLTILLLGGLSAAAFATGMVAALPAIALAAVLAFVFIRYVTLPRAKRRLIERFDQIFEDQHDRELLLRDRAEDLRVMWEEVSPRAREIAEKRGLQSFEKMGWEDRELLEELTSKLIPRLRSDLYNAMRDSEAPEPALEQDRPATFPASEPPRPRVVGGVGSGIPERKTFF